MIDQGAARYLRASRRLRSETACERGESDTDAVLGGHVGGEFVVAAAQVLHERVPAATVPVDWIRLRPRIGKNLALSRP